ncbi:MAG: CHAT domain-containing protein [Bacteroidota bacterium]
MKKTAKLYGKALELQQINQSFLTTTPSGFELSHCIALSNTRSSSEMIELTFEPDDLVALQFSDHTEWIGHPEDIQELYGTVATADRGTQSTTYHFGPQLSQQDEYSRGAIRKAIVTLFSVFRPKNPAQLTARVLGSTYDKKIQPKPGLFAVGANLELTPLKTEVPTTRHLLLLHGTLSNTVSAFGDLMDNGSYPQLFDHYNGGIIALEHHTLSKSPLDNALQFLKACPDDLEIDILSHSRGGLVADILAKCDFNNTKANLGFSTNELRIVADKDRPAHRLMLEINTLAASKRLRVGKIVRVAAPASGTSILSRRVDHFFNLMLNGISLAFGFSNPIYGVVKSFLLELIAQKEDPEVLPGLNSMMPESTFQKMLNATSTEVASTLYIISGDAEVGGLNLNSLKVVLANLFYRTANDLVVDTHRMAHGVKRAQPPYLYRAQDAQTSHFTYFAHPKTCQAMLNALGLALPKGADITFERQLYTEGQRGLLLDLLSLDGIQFAPTTITRDVVILIPGIMGSTLATQGKDRWIQMRELNDGAIVEHLTIGNTAVEASGVVEKFYGKMGHYLSSHYDVITLAYDWRKSLTDAAESLKNQLVTLQNKAPGKVHIVAHSMGGLVVRQCMMDHPEVWATHQKRRKNKLVMLGTPWRGSYLIMEVLTGHSRRVKQLAMIDFDHDRKELLKVFWNYPGVFELLPLEENNNRPFWDPQFWKALDAKANLKHMPNPNSHKRSLNAFKAYRERTMSALEELEDTPELFQNVFYICGQDKETVFDYTFKNRFLSKNQKLVYRGTSKGDGSVTWKTGIPKPLVDSDRLYYTHTTHGDLANEPYIFEGVVDLLQNGTTASLRTSPPADRSGVATITEVYQETEPLLHSTAVVEAIFNAGTRDFPIAEEIAVKVVNADLEMATYPVMVGHFFMDLILSAEKALDGYLDGRLSQRLGIGNYPGQIGESEVFFNLKTQPKGAIICGLGAPEKLTTFLLAKSVKLAALKYAMFMRDNYTLPEAKKYAHGLSCVLVGIGYGKLPVKDSVKGILLGVSAANAYIKEAGNGLRPIKELELLNYYESVASEAYYSLTNMGEKDYRIAINLHQGIVKRPGAKKRKLFANKDYDWWYNLHITSLYETSRECDTLKVSGFKYYSSKGLARIEEEMIGIGLHKISYLLRLNATNSEWDQKLSKTLFEMLIPNGFKDIFRNQSNMVLKMDKNAAEIPWELLHDTATDDTPVAVTSAFIRQLITADGSDARAVPLGNNTVFVVGDPQYNEAALPPLEAAKTEAEWVNTHLTAHQYPTIALIRSTANVILSELYNHTYKIMHFAGHGLYELDQNRVGIAIGDGIFIDPAMLKQMGYVPEFVFINCCHSGTVNAKDEAYYQNRYRLAANIGTELIDMGVKAIIVTGWKVDDQAAMTFAETFYTAMLDGYDFGNSVQKARLATFQKHRNTNTWGAYQCYGHPFYKFNNRQKGKIDELEYVVADQVHTDMDNLLGAIRNSRSDVEATLAQMQHYLDKAQRSGLLDAVVLEKEALIYDELGEGAIAHQKFLELFKFETGNFSIEALEQYCTLKTYQMNADNVKDHLEEIELLKLVGQNTNRLNIIANAHKFASLYITDEEEKSKLLLSALELYAHGFAVATNPYDGGYLDALTNIIFLGHILELRGHGSLMERLRTMALLGKDIDVLPYLLNFYQDLKAYDISDSDLSVQIGITETKYCLMLLKNDFRPAIELDIIAKYDRIFSLMYSPRYIAIEIQQIGFLLHYIKNPTIRKQLAQIRDEIQKLL